MLKIMKPKTIFGICYIILLVLLVSPHGVILEAQNRGLVQESIVEQKRIALVIGNGNYTSARKLANPVNDANDMTIVLEQLGFEVISGTDLSRREMVSKVREFGDRLRITKGVGLFYYAGHGVQVSGRNYLIPVDAEIPREDEVDFASVNLNFIMRKMATANNGLNIVILDACRNNPFARSWSRSAEEGGLAQVNAPTGTFIAYATAPNMTASDGTGRNGLYTTELLKILKRPGLTIEQAFKNVTIAVDQSSAGKQVPWTSSSLRGEFYFVPRNTDLVETSEIENKEPTEINVKERDRSQVEREAWLLIQDSQNPEDFRFFLTEFPKGNYEKMAEIKLEQMVWDSIKNSKDKLVFQDFIDEFPNGANASLARIKFRQLSAVSKTEKKDLADKEKPFSNNKIDDPATKSLKAGTVRKNSIGMEFVWIPPGEFLMGSPDNEEDRDDDEGPQRKVTIAKGFWMGKYEVTQGQFKKILGTNPSKYAKCGANCPVERVTWDEAKEFIRKLNEQDGEFVYSLPTEAEWEYAARAGTTTRYSFGDSSKNLKKYGRHGKTSGTHPVGELLPNPWGLYDIYGNVREWVEDIYNEAGYRGLPTDGSANLTIGDPTKRVLRGGSWIYFSQYLRSANRFMNEPTERDSGIGFRIVARKKIIYKIPLS